MEQTYQNPGGPEQNGSTERPSAYPPGNYYYSQQPKKRKIWPWVLGIVVALGLFGFGLLFISMLTTPLQSTAEIPPPTSPFVAVLHIEGTISSTESTTSLYETATYNQGYLLSSIESLAADHNNLGLLLYIDSPGGEVVPTDEVYQALLEYKQQTGRPIYAYGHNYAASGAYWIAMAADQFYLNRFGITGSIGVSFGTYLDLSELLANYGIKTFTAASGDNKAMGSYFEEMTEDQQQILQGLVTEIYDYFVEIVATGTGLNEARVRQLADGRIYSPKQALEAGLIDGIGDYDEVLAQMYAEQGWEYGTEHHYQYDAPRSLISLWGQAQQAGNSSELQEYLQLAMPLRGFAVYYDGQGF